ncbi:hypothetical protein DIPPA_14369 [Diplonema papillatum]|nr:hypothetical protein DIPPA_14369 [Diplonema papillatum]
MERELQLTFGDDWSGLIKLLDREHQLCLMCHEVFRETPGRWYCLRKLEAHLHQHAEMTASSEATKAACGCRHPAPPAQDAIPGDLLTAEQLNEVVNKTPPAQQVAIFWSCLGRQFDVENPVWPHTKLTEGWQPAKRHAVVVGFKAGRDPTKERLLKRLRKQRREKQQQQEKERRQKETEEAAKKKEAEEKEEEAKPVRAKPLRAKAVPRKRKRVASSSASSSSSCSSS